jgi:hypothetical protein
MAAVCHAAHHDASCATGMAAAAVLGCVELQAVPWTKVSR